MSPLSVLRWRWLRDGGLLVAGLGVLFFTGLAAWGLPAPPALTVEQGPRVSWKWVWQGMRFVNRIQASRRFAAWLPGESGLLVHVGTPGDVHVVERPGAAPARLAGLPDRASHVVLPSGHRKRTAEKSQWPTARAGRANGRPSTRTTAGGRPRVAHGRRRRVDVRRRRGSLLTLGRPGGRGRPAAADHRAVPHLRCREGGARRTIPALIFAAAPEFTGRRPVWISIHGGPVMQTRVVAPPPYELVRRIRVTIIAPNVRGSTGYGKSYAALDDREHREGAVRDIGALIDWIATQPDLDATRVAVAGGSYGGYMTLATLVHYSDRVRCGIELFGISDSVPARHAERIRVPLLIYQGANDVRVKAQESRQMVERIRAAGGTVTYVEAADEGHGLEQPLNQLYFGSLVSEFTARCLVR